jgi:hypothetical protein
MLCEAKTFTKKTGVAPCDHAPRYRVNNRVTKLVVCAPHLSWAMTELLDDESTVVNVRRLD